MLLDLYPSWRTQQESVPVELVGMNSPTHQLTGSHSRDVGMTGVNDPELDLIGTAGPF